jgi:hypothetical protein
MFSQIAYEKQQANLSKVEKRNIFHEVSRIFKFKFNTTWFDKSNNIFG